MALRNKLAMFKNIKVFTDSKDLSMFNIINAFYIIDKILLNYQIYDIKQKIQLTTNRCRNSCNTVSKIFQHLFVYLKLVLIMQYTMLLNYVWLRNSEKPHIILPS